MSGELSRLRPPRGANKKPKIKGRGIGSGHGKTSGRGGKGQKARKSGHVRPGFEGGQMPLQRRLPKRGFHNPFEKLWAEVRVRHLARFDANTELDYETLRAAGLVHGQVDGIKIIGDFDLQVPLKVKVNRISKGAREKIEKAGGTVELIPDTPKWTRPSTREKRRASKQR